MYRAMLMLVLPGVALGAEASSWRTDYSKASKEATEEHKPLALVIGSGPEGWKKLGRDGGIESEALQLFAEKYTPVYINVASPQGKRLARALEMPKGPGIVLTDGTGELQAFRHEGDLTNRRLVVYLKRYADPDRVVTVTESNPGTRRSRAAVRRPARRASFQNVVPFSAACGH